MSDPVARLNAALEGRYAIERELGEGGMATVYLADDLKHERKVALKVLKPELAAVVGAERFLAEIKTTANLQHPHILPLFDSGKAGSFLCYVMPYVEGQTLRERIDREQQLPIEEAVRIATSIAEALDYAHRQGVIHRDIKPANVLLLEGKPVISDFGIALALSASGAGERLTETGLSLGTPHYMSPEQATGDQNVGPQTDTYALGCVLYEMLVGEPPYTGPNAQAVLGQIIAGETASATKKRSSVPANVDAAVRKALEKLPADRFTSAQEFVRALGDEHFRYGEEAEPGRSEGSTLRWKRRAGWWAAAMLVLGVLVGGAAVLLLERGSAAEPVLFVEAPPAGTRFVQAPLLSPDGRRLAMLVTDSVAERKIWVRSLGTEDARALDGTEGASVTFWSPDSRQLVFHTAGELRSTGFDGAGDRLVAPMAITITAGVWTPDDELVVSSEDRILTIPAMGGVPRTIVEGVRYSGLDLVPTGPHLLFGQFGGQAGIHTLDLSSGDRTLLVSGPASRPRYVAPDLLVYVENRVLLAQRFDPSDMSLVGGPFPVAIGATSFSGGAAGALSFVRGASDTYRLVGFDRQGARVGGAAPEGLYSEVYLSPLGTRMMFARADPITGNTDLWVQDLEGNAPPSRITTDPGIDHLAAFSPDGGEIAWEAHAGGVLNLMRRPADGSAPAVLVRAWSRAGGVNDWSPDGEFVLYHSDDGVTGRNLWAVPMEGSAEPFALTESPFDEYQGKFSPDGRWLAYASDASGRLEIYLQRLDGMSLVGGAQRVSDGGGIQPRWRRDGTELFYLSSRRLMVVDTRLAEDLPAGTPRALFDIGEWRSGNTYAVAPDGQRFLATVNEGSATVESAIVILDWAAGLEGR